MTFWNNIKQIFQQAATGTPTNPTIHELIYRSEEDLAAYEYWKNTSGPNRLLNWIGEQYDRERQHQSTDQAVGFLNTPSSKGFVIYFNQTNYSKEEITFFFDYLKERVQTLNYRSDISDRRIFPRRDWVETQERHYLKPRLNFKDELMNQGFGNIMIELELRDDVAHNLRLRATIYKDHLFQEGGTFAALMVTLTAP
ncbi:MAG: hypothetical protein AAF840_08220 [Bacteroidota bacterium]